ncbi:MAG: methyl-accepting chemotaxis protein [Alphaproteobacteria bacterium]|nr:methyl-accepting chemotaxis protein [Alphaproteobacteria bacterium]
MNFKNIKLSKKLPILFIGLSVLSAAVIGFITIQKASNNSLVREAEKLEAIAEARSRQLHVYLRSIEEDLSVMAENHYVRQALYDFKEGWDDLAVRQEARLKELYIENNPHSIGSKEKLDYAPDGSLYSQVHAEHHPWFRHLMMAHDYYDVFLIDRDGNVVYTVFKELDYAANMLDGEYDNTDLAKAFKAARTKAQSKDKQTFFDFRPYSPSNGAPAAFISQPILNEAGDFAGALIFQMPIGRIDGIMEIKNESGKAHHGMGNTGKTYIVGEDGLMRNNLSAERNGLGKDEETILAEKFKTDNEAVKIGLSGKRGTIDGADYEGIQVLSAYVPFDFMGTHWVILAEKDYSEIMAPIKNMKMMALISVFLGSIIIALIGVFISRSISSPILEMTNVMAKIANGDYDAVVPGIGRGDEIGEMASAVEIFKQNGKETERLKAEQEASEKRVQEERKQTMRDIAKQFDEQIGGTIRSLAVASESLQGASATLQTTAQNATESSESVAMASEETSVNVNTVASATEKMTASAQEISRQVEDVASKASEAAGSANHTSKQVNELNGLVENIGEVVFAIKGIAKQTNLLALNATIEAARAGEAGKGFAVVADEVKKLANETSHKTEEIEQRISQIQEATQASVKAMQEIIEGVSDIDGLSANAASAVEEQNAVIAEITRSISEVSQAAQQVTSAIHNVQSASKDTKVAATTVSSSADEVKTLSSSVNEAVQSFLEKIRRDS